MRRTHSTHCWLTCVLLLAVPTMLSAQGLGSLRKKAEDAKKAIEAAGAAARKPAADSSKKIPVADTLKRNPPSDTTHAAAATPSGTRTDAASPSSSKPSAKVWENYDFIPGNKIILFTDFSEDKTGNFARGLKYVGGPLDVVERDGVKMLRSTGRSTFLIPVGRILPQRFTLELDVIAPAGNYGGSELLTFEGGASMDRGVNSADVIWHPNGTAILGSGQNMANSVSGIPDAMQADVRGRVAHLRVLMDSAYFKMYTNERRMYNIPVLAFKRDSVIRVTVTGSENNDMAVYITSIRVAESETDVLYDALAAKGRWSTQGILFATGKADVEPESRPVLKEIAATLKDHPTLRIVIEGHTDNVGAAAGNLALSDARAAAVKTALLTDFGVGSDRIMTRGFGDTKPAAPNVTAQGRAQNRRVEIVKQP